MDDYIHSLPSIEEIIETNNQTKNSLHKDGFHSGKNLCLTNMKP